MLFRSLDSYVGTYLSSSVTKNISNMRFSIEGTSIAPAEGYAKIVYDAGNEAWGVYGRHNGDATPTLKTFLSPRGFVDTLYFSPDGFSFKTSAITISDENYLTLSTVSSPSAYIGFGIGTESDAGDGVSTKLKIYPATSTVIPSEDGLGSIGTLANAFDTGVFNNLCTKLLAAIPANNLFTKAGHTRFYSIAGFQDIYAKIYDGSAYAMKKLTYDNADFNSDFSAKRTNDLLEPNTGAINLWFTPARAQAAIQNTSPVLKNITINGTLTGSTWTDGIVKTDGESSGFVVGKAAASVGLMKISGWSGNIVCGANAVITAGVMSTNNITDPAAAFTPQWQIDPTNTAISPYANNGYSLGRTGRFFNNGFISNLTANTIIVNGASSRVGSLATPFVDGYFTNLLFSLPTSEPANGTFSAVGDTRDYRDGSAIKRKVKTSSSAFTIYTLSAAGGDYTDAQARQALATASNTILGISESSVDPDTLTANQLNLYFNRNTGYIVYQEKDSTSAVTSHALAQIDSDANFLKLRSNPAPVGVSSDCPTILSLPTSEPNVAIDGSPNSPLKVLTLARWGRGSTSNANLATFSISTYAKDGASAHTELGIGLSHDSTTEAGNTPVKYRLRSDGRTGFSTNPLALVTVGGGYDAGDYANQKNQLGFADSTQYGRMHLFVSNHSQTASANGLMLMLHNGTNSTSPNTPLLGTTSCIYFGLSGIEAYRDILPYQDDGINIGSTIRNINNIWASDVIETSDIKLKRDITTDILGSMQAEAENALDVIDKISPIRFKLKNKSFDSIGFDARELFDVRMPGVFAMLDNKKLTFDEFGALSEADKESTSFGINTTSVLGLHHAGIKELLERIKTLECQMAAVLA